MGYAYRRAMRHEFLKTSARICVVGSANMDLTFRTPRFPQLLLDESGSTHVPAMNVDAVDTTGAGDAFTAALAVSLAEGRTLAEAARRASIVAAISVTRLGTQTAFPTDEEVRAWITLKEVQ